jgi:hypothetical protein
MYTIYRIENEDGLGPYRETSPVSTMLCDSHSYLTGHPTRRDDFPSECFEEKDLSPYFCAFDTLEALNEWFSSKEITACDKAGFKIKEIRVKEFIKSISGKQIFFKKEDIIN